MDKKKIFLVEDDQFIVRAYKDSLERASFEVEVALDGVEAMEKLQNITPNLILLDIIMPLKNGFEVLSELKSDDRLKNVPVIILSNLGQDSDIKKGKELGAVDYMVKANYSMQEVIDKIRQYLA
ncbi:MAG: response regulator [Candidatus Niyogibacteria bacterium]|nr:response regulator [Candidatus Niyogibacteria bacterium]